MKNAPEVMPTSHDSQHISPLAQILIDEAQDYAIKHHLTFPGVMSAFATACGALLARAYEDKETAKGVVDRFPIVAMKMIDVMHASDQIVRTRTQ